MLHSKSKNIPSSPLKKKSCMWIRNPEPIQYTDFGRDRKEKYSDFFFYYQSNLHETITLNWLCRVNRDGTRYKYKGNHKSRIFPGTKKNLLLTSFIQTQSAKKFKKMIDIVNNDIVLYS